MIEFRIVFGIQRNSCFLPFTFYLKGQCHEMVVEVRPWSGRLALN
jgi:hypothetical protein